MLRDGGKEHQQCDAQRNPKESEGDGDLAMTSEEVRLGELDDSRNGDAFCISISDNFNYFISVLLNRASIFSFFVP